MTDTAPKSHTDKIIDSLNDQVARQWDRLSPALAAVSDGIERFGVELDDTALLNALVKAAKPAAIILAIRQQREEFLAGLERAATQTHFTNTVYVQKWKSSVRGEGVGPDGISIHRDEEGVLDYRMASVPMGEVPDVYSFPDGNYFPALIDYIIKGRLDQEPSGTLRYHSDEPAYLSLYPEKN